MANTVNDVMNVIASPDYGIKNIAGTNQEILAILQGTHNSKNNIHSIVDDIKNLLQELVGSETKKKAVQISGNNTTKINHKHIQDILDETKGIRKAIDNLSKSIVKQGKFSHTPSVAKLSNKASEKVADAMIKSINKQNKGGGLTSLVDAFEKLKNISLKDIIVGKQKLKLITKIFNKSKENLKIEEKELNSIIKLINAAPEIVKSLYRIGWGINRIIRKNIIGKLSDILVGKNSILSLSILLKKNKKEFIEANKSAKNITALIGNLFISTILLTTIAVTGVPALLGSILLEKIVDKIIPITKKLSKNNKHIAKSVGSALILTAVTGLMAVSSVFLATIAVTGVPALLGSILMLGIVKISISTFKMLNKAKKNILIGSIAMLIMSSSLILFGVALKKIVDATKGVKFKQIGVIATLTLLLGGVVAVLGIPAVAPFILLGSISIAAIGLALIPFAKSLSIISKSTRSLKMKDILLITGSMLSLGLGISSMAILSIPITLGSMVIRTMTNVLYKFTKTLKKISELGTIPTKIVHQTLNAIGTIGNFFISNILKRKAIKSAKRYKKILRPFGDTIKYLSKLKELGVIPMKLVYQTLNAISTIANYYVENPIKKKAIKQAKRYKNILRPFGKTIKYLSKLKDLGVIPMKLVYQTLNTMSTIANYYVKNPIKKKAIEQAKIYKKILRPFGKTIKYLSKLKDLGVIPMKLVYQTLNTMGTIANYYIENPIKKNAIKQAKRYKNTLKLFGKTTKHISKLKNLEEVPINLVFQTLNAMGTIANYYVENPIKKKAIKQAKRYKKVLKIFGKTIPHLSKLKELEVIPIDAVISSVIAMKHISSFYNELKLVDDIEFKSTITEFIVNKFANTAVDFYNKFVNVKEIDYSAFSSIIYAFSHIVSFYNKKFSAKRSKIKRMNFAVKLFAESANYLKENMPDFTIRDYLNVSLSVDTMRKIIRFLKYNVLTQKQRKRARYKLLLLKDMASVMTSLSKVNLSNIMSVGDALTHTINGIDDIDLDKVETVTNMFNAFNGINKSENIINKFKESVEEFTEACKNLMYVMSNNTDAINNIDSFGRNSSYTNEIIETNFIEKSSNGNEIQTGGIRIANVDEIAKTIAEKINGALSLDVPDTQVQLLINGTGGNEWTITRY